MRGLVLTLAALAMAGSLGGWFGRPGPAPHDWRLPAAVPPPPVPADNPMTAARVALGRALFYDTRLSVNGSVACATCHQQRLAFTDGRARSPGATGELTPRSAMSLVNAAYNTTFDWANPAVTRLEHQMLTPLFGEDPIEMGLAGQQQRVLAELGADPDYVRQFAAAFPADEQPFRWQNVIAAIASFVRGIVSYDSPYDRYVRGDNAALTAAAVRGLELFLSEDLECFHCHGGFNFTDSSTHDPAAGPPPLFHHTALHDIDGRGGYPAPNRGLYEITGEPGDMGRFRAPTLRNIARTAPYMHDGSIATLSEVLDHYAAGGLATSGAPAANRSEFVRGFELTERQRADVLEFLNSLTDASVLSDPRFADPKPPGG